NLNNHMLEVEGVYVAVMKSYGKKRESPRSSKRLRKDGFLRFLLSLCGNATRSHSGGTEHGTTVKKLQEVCKAVQLFEYYTLFFVMCEFAGYSLCEGNLTVIEPNLDYKCVSSDCRKHERY
ncbi:BnaCnng35450D, partial [Brassica napus]